MLLLMVKIISGEFCVQDGIQTGSERFFMVWNREELIKFQPELRPGS